MSTRVDEMKKTIVWYAKQGMAVHFNGIIVSPGFMEELTEDKNPSDLFHVIGTEGNRAIRYSFYIHVDPSMPDTVTEGYFLTHFTKERYTEEILGRIPEVLAMDKLTAQVDFMTITGFNRIRGAVEVSYGNGSSWYYNVHFEEIVDTLNQARKAEGNLHRFLAKQFDHQGPTRNQPESHWVGEVHFNRIGNLLSFKPAGSEPYKMTDDDLSQDFPDNKRLMGRLLMQRFNGMYRIVGIAKNGYGMPVTVPFPGMESADQYEFASIAMRYFLPEEIFDFLGLRMQAELERIRAIPVNEYWGTWSDPEKLGRMETFTVSGGRVGHIISVDCIDTKAKVHPIEIAFVEGSESSDEWHIVYARYFPEDWSGWPASKMDASIARMADSIR